jgi:hypothetical protein
MHVTKTQTTTETTTAPEPTRRDLDEIIKTLETTWKATITVRRQSKEDVGYREVILLLDGQHLAILNHGDAITREIPPGAHRLKATNTLFSKTLDFTLNVGEHASFTAENRAGWGTYSMFAFFMGFIGAGPLYLTFTRDGANGP